MEMGVGLNLILNHGITGAPREDQAVFSKRVASGKLPALQGQVRHPKD